MHDDVIKWKHFPRNWPFVRGIHRSRWIPHTKASDAELLMFTLICVWINGWVNNGEAGDLRRYRGHYDVIVMDRKYKYISDNVSKNKFSMTRVNIEKMQHHKLSLWKPVTTRNAGSCWLTHQSGRSPKVVAHFLLQTLVAIWYDFSNCMIQSKWNQIMQESTIIIII